MTETERSDQRRRLPAVSRVLEAPALRSLGELYGRAAIAGCARDALEQLRSRLAADEAGLPASTAELSALLVEEITARVESHLGRRLARMLNATGIFLHTNLGRAPLPRQVAASLPGLLDAYCDLELERDSGRRGDRNRRVARLLQSLTATEAALVVNNNAAAVVLALATLAPGREVVVSRGELVEIGGSFRIAEIIAASGARLVEVGSTNRTRIADYRDAVSDQTAVLLKIFPSNFRISGFTESVGPAQLVELGAEHGLAVLVDEGSGLVRPHAAPQLRGHLSLSELLALGCDLVCGSGDKLLGGPQAGLLLGRRRAVDACKRNPLYRALRPDRACLAALEGVLEIHLASGELPIDRLWPDAEAHRLRLDRLAAACGGEIVAADAFFGGGAAPDAPIAGLAVALAGKQALVARLREGDPPVVGYIRDDRVVLDLRTVDPADDDLLVVAVRDALEEGARR